MMEAPKEFSKALDFFLHKLSENQSFALGRFGDGEMLIMEGESLDNGQFKFDDNNPKYIRSKELLLEAFQYQHPDYYTGISCRCCILGVEGHEKMKLLSGQDESQLTWSNIFVNANYTRFLFGLKKAIAKKPIVLFANKKADLTCFDYNVIKYYGIGVNAWIDQFALIEEVKAYIQNNKIKGHIFIFAAGPFSNLLIYELHKFDQNNTYLDIGSSVDVMLGLNPARDYQVGKDYLSKTCIW